MAEKQTKKTEDVEADAPVLRVYEAGYLIVPTVKEEDLDTVVGGVRAVIERAGGSFIAEGAPTLTKLAYIMYKHEKGRQIPNDRAYFGWLKFEAPAAAARDVADTLKTNAEILRSMVFKTLREDTRAKFRAPVLREVKRTDTAKAPTREAEEAAPVSEEKLEQALESLTV
jgi:ribosomal protein S6